MPNTAPLVLTDGTNPMTFNPASVDSATASFIEDDLAKAFLNRAVVNVDQIKNKNLVKRNVRVTLPFVDSDGNRTFENCSFQFTGLNTSTKAQREAALNVLVAALQDASVQDVILNPEWFW